MDASFVNSEGAVQKTGIAILVGSCNRQHTLIIPKLVSDWLQTINNGRAHRMETVMDNEKTVTICVNNHEAAKQINLEEKVLDVIQIVLIFVDRSNDHAEESLEEVSFESKIFLLIIQM